MPDAQSRRLVAILFTDVVGYSSLMAAEEERALRVRARHRELVRPLVERAYEQRAYRLVQLGVDERWDPIRSEPRFRALVGKVGLPESAAGLDARSGDLRGQVRQAEQDLARIPGWSSAATSLVGYPRLSNRERPCTSPNLYVS